MVSIWDEIFFIPKQTGSKKISVEIDPAFVRNPHVFFDIYEKDDLWTVYWRSGMRTNDIIAVARSLNLVKMPAEEAFKNEKFIEAINLASPVFSFELDKDLADILRRLCKDGLPEIYLPSGLDGHDYKITFIDLGKEYNTWCDWPIEWKDFARVINQCVMNAKLDVDCYGCFISKR